MAGNRDVTAQLGAILARHERHLLGLRAELESTPTLTAWKDAPLDLALVLDPVSRAIADAAMAIAARPEPSSRRTTLGGELSVLWAGVIEIEPDGSEGTGATEISPAPGRLPTAGCSGRSRTPGGVSLGEPCAPVPLVAPPGFTMRAAMELAGSIGRRWPDGS